VNKHVNILIDERVCQCRIIIINIIIIKFSTCEHARFLTTLVRLLFAGTRVDLRLEEAQEAELISLVRFFDRAQTLFWSDFGQFQRTPFDDIVLYVIIVFALFIVCG